jgi:hypothetical protein
MYNASSNDREAGAKEGSGTEVHRLAFDVARVVDQQLRQHSTKLHLGRLTQLPLQDGTPATSEPATTRKAVTEQKKSALTVVRYCSTHTPSPYAPKSVFRFGNSTLSVTICANVVCKKQNNHTAGFSGRAFETPATE